MPNVIRLPKVAKQPKRPHYIAEWAELRGWKRVDIVRMTGADKGLVSRWYKGASPGEQWQAKLAEIFDLEPGDIFSHPDDVWFRQLIRGRKPDDVLHIKRAMETIFPRKSVQK
jgi:hypothetical protein